MKDVSPQNLIAHLPEAERLAAIRRIAPTLKEKTALLWKWRGWYARPSQLEPVDEDWVVWLILAGRGFGKSRTGAEWVSEKARHGVYGRLALVAETAADARDVMIEGESGILNVGPQDQRPRYEPSKRRLTWPNGAMATAYSAEEPDQLRGPQHDAFWADEAAKWRYADAWDQLMFGLRLGDRPRGVVTTTPRPIKLIRDLVADPTTRTTRGSTYANVANLAPSFLAKVVAKYEGTRLGRQELQAEMLDDVPGALWKRDNILHEKAAPELRRIVVSVDPATTSGEDSDETGIIVAGIDKTGHGWILDDLTTRGTPNEWAKIVVDAYEKYRADRVIGETNQGGEMVENTIRTILPSVSYKGVHVKRGKVLRAEPVAALYEQHKVTHVGYLASLEDQMCAFTSDFDASRAGYSPDRVDALTQALSELAIGSKAPIEISQELLDWA